MYVAMTPSSVSSNFLVLPEFQINILCSAVGKAFSSVSPCIYTIFVGLTSMVTLNSKCSCIDSLMSIPLRALISETDWPYGCWISLDCVSSGPSVGLLWFLVYKYLCRWIFWFPFFKKKIIIFQMPEVMRGLCARTGVWFVLRCCEGMWGPLRTEGFLGLSWKSVLVRGSRIWHSACS